MLANARRSALFAPAQLNYPITKFPNYTIGYFPFSTAVSRAALHSTNEPS